MNASRTCKKSSQTGGESVPSLNGRLFIGLGSVLLLCINVAAQPSIRNVSGTVTDQYGDPLKGAVVQIENCTLLGIRSYITQIDGKYRFSGLYWDTDYRLKAFYEAEKGPPKTLSRFDSSDSKVINLEVRS